MIKPHFGGAFCYLAFIALTNRKTRSINVLFPHTLSPFSLWPRTAPWLRQARTSDVRLSSDLSMHLAKRYWCSLPLIQLLIHPLIRQYSFSIRRQTFLIACTEDHNRQSEPKECPVVQFNAHSVTKIPNAHLSSTKKWINNMERLQNRRQTQNSEVKTMSYTWNPNTRISRIEFQINVNPVAQPRSVVAYLLRL